MASAERGAVDDSFLDEVDDSFLDEVDAAPADDSVFFDRSDADNPGPPISPQEMQTLQLPRGQSIKFALAKLRNKEPLSPLDRDMLKQYLADRENQQPVPTLEAANALGANAFAAELGDEGVGLARAAMEKLRGNPQGVAGLYQHERDAIRAYLAQAKKDNPVTGTASQILGAGAAGIMGPAGRLANLAQGALMGAGASEKGTAGGTLVDAAKGAGLAELGRIGGEVFGAIGKEALGAAGRGVARALKWPGKVAGSVDEMLSGAPKAAPPAPDVPFAGGEGPPLELAASVRQARQPARVFDEEPFSIAERPRQRTARPPIDLPPEPEPAPIGVRVPKPGAGASDEAKIAWAMDASIHADDVAKWRPPTPDEEARAAVAVKNLSDRGLQNAVDPTIVRKGGTKPIPSGAAFKDPKLPDTRRLPLGEASAPDARLPDDFSGSGSFNFGANAKPPPGPPTPAVVPKFKTKAQAWEQMKSASGIDDYDAARADAAYKLFLLKRGKRPAPFPGGHFDEINAQLDLPPGKGVSGGLEAFYRLSKGAKTWQDLERSIEMLRRVPGLEGFRVPDDVQEALIAGRPAAALPAGRPPMSAEIRNAAGMKSPMAVHQPKVQPRGFDADKDPRRHLRFEHYDEPEEAYEAFGDSAVGWSRAKERNFGFEDSRQFRPRSQPQPVQAEAQRMAVGARTPREPIDLPPEPPSPALELAREPKPRPQAPRPTEAEIFSVADTPPPVQPRPRPQAIEMPEPEAVRASAQAKAPWAVSDDAAAARDRLVSGARQRLAKYAKDSTVRAGVDVMTVAGDALEQFVAGKMKPAAFAAAAADDPGLLLRLAQSGGRIGLAGQEIMRAMREGGANAAKARMFILSQQPWFRNELAQEKSSESSM